ncbi:DMT family transporter [Nonomuraea jiangxiensis]|uniref:DMT family transporter n=1 Tax=Nonomuraea jiangxiensis TaxID=633440 RepID=UPI001C40B449|nr:DMT family transporter [Nonomuraea jiangxiensis]
MGAALLLGLGFVAQQHAAYREPLEEMLHVRLLLNLMHMPTWLAGFGLMICGQILGAVALREADVAEVEPLLAMNLLFALTAAHLVYKEPFGRMLQLGAVLVSGGVALFLFAGRPHGGHLPDPISSQWLAALPAVLVATALVSLGLRRSLKIKAMSLAAAAGVLYGVQDVLTRSSLLTLDSGLSLLGQWQPYALPCVAVVGLLLNQSAFDAAPLQISLPATTAVEPITGIVLGAVIFSERLRVSPEALAGEVAGLVAMVTGTIILGRSRLLAKPADRASRRRRGVEER